MEVTLESLVLGIVEEKAGMLAEAATAKTRSNDYAVRLQALQSAMEADDRKKIADIPHGEDLFQISVGPVKVLPPMSEIRQAAFAAYIESLKGGQFVADDAMAFVNAYRKERATTQMRIKVTKQKSGGGGAGVVTFKQMTESETATDNEHEPPAVIPSRKRTRGTGLVD